MKLIHYAGEQVLGIYDTNIHKVIPNPNIEISEELWQAFLNNQRCYKVINGELVYDGEPPKTAAQIKAELTVIVQSHLDSTAQLKGYDNILSATSYAGYVNDYQAEGIAYGVWRSAVWNKCYEIMAAVQAGTRTVPTEAELLAELPTLTL